MFLIFFFNLLVFPSYLKAVIKVGRNVLGASMNMQEKAMF